MFVVTFYSYKGGVGRSLALANVAAELAMRGKSVLIVDFDLEAPGASSFDFGSRVSDYESRPGIVEFIDEWITAGEVPAVENYVYKWDVNSGANGSIWVMPAGRVDNTYSSRLQQVDFESLYENHEGFLLIEDLKAQWKSVLDVDYVLIDSRTGHTDIGGICTRQLPDLVVFVFWPNTQNLAGLSLILNDLKDEEQETGRAISRLFVPSNLPTLDDEVGLLKDLLERFRQSLGYDQVDELRLHHYQSLDLLEQKIFTFHRPKSRLAQEYRDLTDAVQMRNRSDEVGVTLYLRKILNSDKFLTGERLGQNIPLSITNEDHKILKEIYAGKWKSPAIVRTLAMLRAAEGDFIAASNFLQQIISNGEETLTDYLQLGEWAVINGTAPNLDAIVTRLLTDDEASQRHVLAVLNIAARTLPDKHSLSAEKFANSPAVKRLSVDQLAALCALSQDNDVKVELVGKAVKQVMHADNLGQFLDLDDSDSSVIALTLIGAKYFEEAQDLLTTSNLNGEEITTLRRLFNLSFAIWGASGKAPMYTFLEVIRLHEKVGDDFSNNPNYAQCISVAYSVVGQIEIAKEMLLRAYNNHSSEMSSVFSCWSYRTRSSDLFRKELDEQREQLVRGVVAPSIIRDRVVDTSSSP